MTLTCNLNAVRDAGVVRAASVPGSRCSRKKEQAPRRASSTDPRRDHRPLQGLQLQGSRLVLVLLWYPLLSVLRMALTKW